MPRPPRIEYEHAFYHVMNRGKARQMICHGDIYYETFLMTVAEACQRFDCIVHAYCLMGNHYHLIIETPNANLSRVMRHINGVYTQRYNRLNKTDGPLFRGRYKAILVDQDSYLLRLTRYIHRNPIDMKRPLVTQLAEYRWSSYPAYIGKNKPPEWLCQDKTYRMLGHKERYTGYEAYVLAGVDQETADFYRKGNMASLIGDKGFREWVYEALLPQLEATEKGRIVQPDLTMIQVIQGVASAYDALEDDITKRTKGPQQENKPRKLAMHLCQELAGAKLTDIVAQFNLSNIGSVSFITHQIRKRADEDLLLRREIERLTKSIIKQAT